MAATAFVRARIDEGLKNEAAVVLAEMGKDHALPFELKVPNATTRAAMQESRAMMKARTARFSDGEALINALEQEDR